MHIERSSIVMQGDLNNVSYNIKEIEHDEDFNIYHVSMEIPINMGWIDNVCFNIGPFSSGLHENRLDYEKTVDGKATFSKDIKLDNYALYKFDFSFWANGQLRTLTKDNVLKYGNIMPYEQSKMSVNFDVPDWAKGKMMYHIFVDRFCRGSKEEMKPMPRRDIHKSWDEDMILGPDKDGVWNADFYGGDLKGITSKLDYINSLGVSILYLSPIVWSQSNHRYDAADYENVDPYAGCNADLAELCKAAHAKGMKVILDGVFNHTGNDSKYFNELHTFDTKGAFDNPNSPYSKFYRSHQFNGKKYYDFWWGFGNLPECDGFSKEWQEYITGKGGVIDQWFANGIDGLRLDVADELTDEYLSLIRQAVRRNKKDGFVLGEVWENPMRKNRGYIESGKCMDSVMNYPLVDALIRYFKYDDKYKLSYIIQDILNEYPEGTIHSLMNFTSTHDISRAINIFSTNEFKTDGQWAWDLKNSDLNYCKDSKLTQEQYNHGKEVYEAYIFALTFMPGILSVFYGDEAGVKGLGSLDNRKTFPWNNEDLELVDTFKNAGRVRNEEPFLEKADIHVLDINDKFFMFERQNKGDKALVTINRTNELATYVVPKEYENSNKVYTLKKSLPGILTPYGGVAIRNK